MRNLVLGLALASTALATPAIARDKSWYVEGDLGGVISGKQAVTQASNGLPVGTLVTKPGYDLGGSVGYDFGGFRLEAETSYRRASGSTYTSNNGTVYSTTSGQLTQTSTDALGFMMNGLLDFGPDDGMQGFVGAGAGVARVKENINTPVAALNITDAATGFAWQLLAGARVPLSSSWPPGSRVMLPLPLTSAMTLSPSRTGSQPKRVRPVNSARMPLSPP